jgi:hypothetical protein
MLLRGKIGRAAALAAVLVVTLSVGFSAAAAPASDTPLRRIVSRPDGLFVAGTGAPFVARGANYTRLAQDSGGGVYHATFEPGRYDQARVTAFLDQMRHDGYNVARVFIDPGSADGEHGIGGGMSFTGTMSGPYLDNVAAFVRSAAERGIYTLPALDYFPTNSHYWGIVAAETTGDANMDGQNLSYLEGGRVAAKAAYLADFVAALADRLGAPQLTAVLAYESDNEAFFDAGKAPFNRMTGTVTPLNGVTYDMSDPAQRQQAADASLVEYTIRLKSSLTAADPDALLATGFFSYQAVGKQGPDGFAKHCESGCGSGNAWWYPGRAGILSYWGAVDLLDIHMYENHGAAVLDSLEMGQRKDPFLIGEFGTLKETYHNDITAAAYGMRDLEREECRLGAVGYLYFTWDTTEPLASLEKFYHLTDANGAINGVLAPIVRPDPCQ